MSAEAIPGGDLGNYTHNGPPVAVVPTTTVTADSPLAARVNHLATRFRFQRMARDNAAASVRELKKAHRAAKALEFAAIEERAAEIRNERKALFEACDGLGDAEEDRKAASAGMRDVLKDAEALGVDPVALRAAVHLGDLDPIEREERFDAIDAYAKAMRLWDMVRT